jgi:tungstate transport system substrate-binding protein
VRAVAALALVAGCSHAPSSSDADAPAPLPPQTIRVAVIGGMIETGLWPALADRFHAETGHEIELVATGPKPVVIDAFRKGGVDLLTLHASDGIVNVVADGLAVDPQPWARNDLVIVGPPADPAGIRGMKDAGTAVKQLLAHGDKIVVHASMGADLVLADLMEAAHVTMPDGAAILYAGDRPQQVLARAAAAGAYTLVGRIPWLQNKIPHAGLELMVQGDPHLRRPYLVVVAAGAADDPRLRAAHQLAAWLRAPATQAWLATFGKGRYDDQPLFFPITAPRS